MVRSVAPPEAPVRTGLGHDRHPFGPGEPLQLGGISIAGAPRLHGHSDGDVALHAIADAILGAVGAGDLGRLAPADDRTPLGIASATLLERAIARAADAGWVPAGLDVTITGARPRLADHLEAMRARIAELTSLTVDRVSVKASTANLQGVEGEGRAISADALATLVRSGRP
jgi:2-C-methyl-D-erythritol 2,4-cyclodiphosphate synthase